MPVADLPPLNALRAFEVAARLGSLSRAADELHVTHGAVSRQVRLLEEAVGTPLFERAGRGLRLTAAGMRLRDAAGDAFDQLRSAITTIHATPVITRMPSVRARETDRAMPTTPRP